MPPLGVPLLLVPLPEVPPLEAPLPDVLPPGLPDGLAPEDAPGAPDDGVLALPEEDPEVPLPDGAVSLPGLAGAGDGAGVVAAGGAAGAGVLLAGACAPSGASVDDFLLQPVTARPAMTSPKAMLVSLYRFIVYFPF